MPQVKTKKQLFLQQAWKTAWKEGKVEIDLGTVGASQKQRLRMALYNAVKAGKQNLDDDHEVNMAAQEVEIVNGPDPTKLYMRRVIDSPVMQALAKAIGTNMDEVKDPAIEQSLKLLEELGHFAKPQAAAPVTSELRPEETPVIPAFGRKIPNPYKD